MPGLRSLTALVFTALVAMPAMAHEVAEGPDILSFGKPGGGGGGGTTTRPADYYSWMHLEVKVAWDSYRAYGAGAEITVVDDFTSRNKYFGNLGHGIERLRHGEWTHKQAGMVAPHSAMVARDWGDNATGLDLASVDVLNLSYGYMGDQDEVIVDPLQTSIVDAAWSTTVQPPAAFVSKAAGNQQTPVDGVFLYDMNGDGVKEEVYDILTRDLIGAKGAVFVGALVRHGTTDDSTQMADYSAYAGTSLIYDEEGDILYHENGQPRRVSDQFLVVGVEDFDMGGLAGTSFAAPVVSAYGAIIGSKFGTDRPDLIANQLLSTAKTNTIIGYNRDIHGVGEASIANALSAEWVQ